MAGTIATQHIELLRRRKGGNTIGWEVQSSLPISESQAQQFQREQGYHPAGYGFFSFYTAGQPGRYYARWHCQASCD